MVSTTIGQYSFIAVSRTHETGMSNICFIGLQFSVYAHGIYQKFDTAQFPEHFLRKVFNKLCQYMEVNKILREGEGTFFFASPRHFDLLN